MQIRLYTKQPFKNSDRTSFELPAWPHSSNPKAVEVFKKWMKDNYIFYYADNSPEGERNGPIIILDGIDLDDKYAEFYHTGFVDDSKFKIQEYPDSWINKDKNALNNFELYGDKAAWLEYNSIGDFELVNKMTGSHKFQKRLEYMRCFDGECSKDRETLGLNFKIG